SKALDHQMERCKALADEWERLKAGFEQEKQAINEDRRETNEALEELGERYREQINALAQEDAFDWDDEDWGDDEEEIWGTHWAELESPNSEVCSADTCSDTHPEEDETLSVSELMHWLDSGEKVGELLSDALLAIGIIPTPQTRLASTVIQGLSKTALISLSAGLKARARQLIANGGWVGNNVSKEIIKSAGSSRGFKSVTSDLNGGIESANRIFRVLTSSKPVEGIITRIPNKNIELYLRSKSKTGTPVLEIKNYKLRTYEKIHFNP
ncbi:MAG: hypothetical protein ACR2PX_25350, partial [Endozoicomonas sp.]|uniref:hypothetical protein n=1 Tax=Endozoicomonas sp. TaxID=1892382 RepID=UPI003D9AE16B